MRNKYYIICSALLVVACGGDGSDDNSNTNNTNTNNNNNSAPDCTANTDCDLGFICSGETCVAGCDTNERCPDSELCCTGSCVDTTISVAHCGSCDNACTGTDFCGPNTCTALEFDSLCDFTSAANLIDGFARDDAAGADVLAAYVSSCGGSDRTLSQDSEQVIASDGAPLTAPDELLIVLGGSFGRPVVGYLETAGLTPVVYEDTDTGSGYRLSESDGTTITSGTKASLTATHDVFVAYFVTEPSTGAVLLVAWGVDAAGTEAAAVFLEDEVFNASAPNMLNWYVVDWTDDDATTGPSSGDSFSILGSGM